MSHRVVEQLTKLMELLDDATPLRADDWGTIAPTEHGIAANDAAFAHALAEPPQFRRSRAKKDANSAGILQIQRIRRRSRKTRGIAPKPHGCRVVADFHAAAPVSKRSLPHNEYVSLFRFRHRHR